MMKMRHCYLCNSHKLESEFYRDKSRTSGFASRCKECSYKFRKPRTAQMQRYYEQRKHDPVFKEKRAEKRRKWNNENRRYLDIKYGTVRRLRFKQQKPIWADNAKIRAFYDDAHRQGLTVDHIVPLISPLVCGLHWEGNFQMLTLEENGAKGNRLQGDRV